MEKSFRYLPILSGILTAVAAFAVLLTLIAGFMPVFLRFATNSRWTGLIIVVTPFFVLGSGWKLRKRRSARLKRSLG